jgi:hypothetical protein
MQIGHVGKLTAGAGLQAGKGILFVEMVLLSIGSLFVFISEVSGIGCVLNRFGGLMIIDDRNSFGCVEVEAALKG